MKNNNSNISESPMDSNANSPPSQSRKYIPTLNRQEMVHIRQLRSGGHSKLLGTYRHRIGIQKNANCIFCNNDIGTVYHLICQCSSFKNEREELFGPTELSTRILTKLPGQTAHLIKSILSRYQNLTLKILTRDSKNSKLGVFHTERKKRKPDSKSKIRKIINDLFYNCVSIPEDSISRSGYNSKKKLKINSANGY